MKSTQSTWTVLVGGSLALCIAFLSSAHAETTAENKDKGTPAAPKPPAPNPNPNAAAPNPAGANPPAEHTNFSVLRLNTQIRGADLKVRDLAIAQIRLMLAQDPRVFKDFMSTLRNSWLKTLEGAKRFDVVAEFSENALIWAADDTEALEDFLAFRVRALMALNKKNEMLVAAKQYFNVTSMKNTSNAILVMSQCLDAAYPDNNEIYARFRTQQVEAAQAPDASKPKTPPAPDAAKPKPTQPSVLAGIVIDPKPYDTGLCHWVAEGYKGLVARGNLRLLGGNIQKAREEFELAYTVAETTELPVATENLARCIKAEDGGIGRMNAWIVSIRAKPAGKSVLDFGVQLEPAKVN